MLEIAGRYDADSFNEACDELASLLGGMQGDLANSVRSLFVDKPQEFKAVVFYGGSAMGATEGVGWLRLEPSESFKKLLSAASASDFETVRIIVHEIRSLDGVAAPG